MAGKGHVEKVFYDHHGKWVWLSKLMPWHYAVFASGVFLPPHERYWLSIFFGDTKENISIGSRGTSKSFSHASLAAPLKASLFPNRAILTLSASGFRGGKELFRDAARLFEGQLKSQLIPGEYLSAGISTQKTIQKDPSIWSINLKSRSRYSTVPTNNPEQLRGLRAQEVIGDEANFMEPTIMPKIVRPMLNVGSDFRQTAKGGDDNKIYQISTIDFTMRPFYQEVLVAQDLQRREYEAFLAQEDGDWEEFDRLMNEKDGQLKTASFSLTRYDYTDLLIPEYITTLDGEKTYKVNYPCDPGIEIEDIIKYDEQEERNLIYTYPLDKKGLEQGRRDGVVDEEIWLSEQRNIPVASSGNVFGYDLIRKISELPVYSAKDTPKSRRRRNTEGEDEVGEEEYYAPIMYTCGDPCVLGIDVADAPAENAFIVIRLGELAEGEFDPQMEQYDEEGRQVLGYTNWNHICWAQSWKKREAGDMANYIRDFKKRYNIVALFPVHGADETIAGIAMDKRGGGTAVRDELGNPKPPVNDDGTPDSSWNWNDVLKIYDPDDEPFKHYEGLSDPMYWGGLKLITSTNNDNVDWTYTTRAMMDKKKLYIGFWEAPSRWAFQKGFVNAAGEPDKDNPDFLKWLDGYNGIRRLKSQLLKLQRKVTEGSHVIRFVMPGDQTKEEGQKDLWAAMIYAVSIGRQHINTKTKKEEAPPLVEPLIVDNSALLVGTAANDFI